MVVKRVLEPHQEAAVADLSNGKVLHGGVGSGKTITALEYYIRNESPRDIYVITTAKKRDKFDWQKEANNFGINMEKEFSDHGKITVSSWNLIGRYRDVKDAFFIFDEQRLVGTGAWVKSFYEIAKKNRWIMLSATPGDTWSDYIPLFVAHGWYRNKTDFMSQHAVYAVYSKYPKVDRYISEGRLLKYRKELLVKMPFERHTTRHIEEVFVDFDKELFDQVWKKRWHIYEDRPLNNRSEQFIVMRKLVNSHPSRLEKIVELFDKHKKLIVFYNFDYELDELRKLEDICKKTMKDHSESSSMDSLSQITGSQLSEEASNGATFGLAEWNGHKHEEIPTTDSWIYLVQYVAGAEAWDCIETNAMIFYSLTYSYKNFEQAQGRIDRMNTPFTDLYYYVLMSKSVVDKAVWSSLRRKKRFQESRFKW